MQLFFLNACCRNKQWRKCFRISIKVKQNLKMLAVYQTILSLFYCNTLLRCAQLINYVLSTRKWLIEPFVALAKQINICNFTWSPQQLNKSFSVYPMRSMTVSASIDLICCHRILAEACELITEELRVPILYRSQTKTPLARRASGLPKQNLEHRSRPLLKLKSSLPCSSNMVTYLSLFNYIVQENLEHSTVFGIANVINAQLLTLKCSDYTKTKSKRGLVTFLTSKLCVLERE